MKKYINIVLHCIIFNHVAMAQSQFGDPSVVPRIDSKASYLYENNNNTHFFLTKKTFLGKRTSGSNIVAYTQKDTLHRIIVSTTTREGMLAKEFYFENNQLIFTYQTLECFAEASLYKNWKNFKGFHGWESRFYFEKGELKYQKHNGLNSKTPVIGKTVLMEAQNIKNFVLTQLNQN
ncbi:MAG: hypothetical protein JNL70_13795 [Saprospiraceae bacterium]|nr:hypothetical protein [Saprospiraceae bacterium]